MSWKNWPSWVKGGVIGCWIYGIVMALFLIANMAEPGNLTFAFLLFPFLPPVGFFLNFIILPLFVYFIIGAVIGLIVGKIKSKKANKDV